MNVELAAENPGACRVLEALLERYLSSGDKARPVRLDDRRMPEFGRHARPGEADETWEAVQSLERAGIITIDQVRAKPGKASYEMAPLVRLVPSEAQRAAGLIGFPLDKDPWTKEWISACAAASWLPEELRQTLGGRPHRIGNRSPIEILECWKRLVDPRIKVVYLREAAARTFWGLSKVLDERLGLVNQLRTVSGLEPLIEAPVLVNVHLVANGLATGVLFIENQSTFEAATRRRVPATGGMHLVYSSGFKASAVRLRKAETASLYPSDKSSVSEIDRFRTWFFSDDYVVPTFFWGDLDFSALAILRSLKSVFNSMQAWRPGYEQLLAALKRGEGHLPDEDPRKGEQRQVPGTGCLFADEEILPALLSVGRFVDQEAILP